MELRDYQVECVNKIKEMKEGEKKIVQAGCGAGKTIIFSKVSSELKSRVLCVVDQDEIAEQTLQKMMIFMPREEIGIVRGNLNESERRVIITTRQSLDHNKSTRIKDILSHGDIDLTIYDEAHRGVKMCKRIAERINSKRIVGFTATPFNEEMKELYDDFIFKKPVEELIEEGYLVSPRCLTVQTDVDISSVKTVLGDYAIGELDKLVNVSYRNELIVDAYIKHASDRKHVICFAASIEHSEELAKAFREKGIVAKSIDSTLSPKERKEAIESFRRGQITVLTSVGCLTTGFDAEMTDLAIMARPTKSLALFHQMIGRVLRLWENKQDALILEITDNLTRRNKRMSLLSCKDIFNLEENETFKERNERLEREAEEERLERERIEQERLEAERIEQELILKEISLFNETVQNISGVSSLHWFFTDINKKEVAILSINGNVDYYIFKMGEEFVCLKRTQGENYTYKLEEIERSNNLKELVDTVEENAIKEGSSFISKSAKWKWEQPTPKQVQACKSNVTTKWGVHCFFSKRNCYFSLKDVI
ncbi:DEAD/DEAH box helicase [Clostridium saudiense]|uniref:DEAD/DEAH box helicase n=1 Tax=Clostridium saudiense TaxID=1414720 RepID=UPI00319D8EF2